MFTYTKLFYILIVTLYLPFKYTDKYISILYFNIQPNWFKNVQVQVYEVWLILVFMHLHDCTLRRNWNQSDLMTGLGISEHQKSILILYF